MRIGLVALAVIYCIPQASAGLREPDIPPFKRKLTEQHPWLSRLSNGPEIIALYALRLAWTREYENVARARDKLPDPARTHESDKKRARRRARAPLNERYAQIKRALAKLPNNTRIELTELFADDFLDHRLPAMERAGRTALAAEIQRHRGSVGLRIQKNSFRVYVYMNGLGLPIRDHRLRTDAFFQRTESSMFAVQSAYHAGRAAAGKRELRDVIARQPAIMGEHFEHFVTEQRRAAIDQAVQTTYITNEERDIRAMKAERIHRSDSARASVQAAMVPIVVIVSLFAVESSTDLFLALFPVGNATKLVKRIRALPAGRQVKKLMEELPGVLDTGQANFVRLTARLSAREMRALRGIHEHVKSPEIVLGLMVRANAGTANLGWIRKKLKNGTFDEAFVENFTRYDVHPTWNQLESVLKNKIARNSRQSLMSVWI